MLMRARAFAEPILTAVRDRPADFEDDFSTQDKGWAFLFGMHGRDGTFAIEEGIARFHIGPSDGETDAYIFHPALNRKDFVLQLDARLVKGDAASRMQVFFHGISPNYWFNLNLYSQLGAWDVGKMWRGQSQNLASGVGNVNPIGEITRVIIVAQGRQCAIYLNGMAVAYFEDSDFNTSGQTLLFCSASSQTVCEFDNVRFWDLTNLSGLP